MELGDHHSYDSSQSGIAGILCQLEVCCSTEADAREHESGREGERERRAWSERSTTLDGQDGTQEAAEPVCVSDYNTQKRSNLDRSRSVPS